MQAVVLVAPIEVAAVMEALIAGPNAMTKPPPIWAEFTGILVAVGVTDCLQQLERFAFYFLACGPGVALIIATAEQRIYDSILFTTGAVTPD